MTTNNLIRRYIVIGERRFSNYWWATIILIGAVGFLITGVLSYLNTQISSTDFGAIQSITTNSTDTSLLSELPSKSTIAFFPQGLLMCFYGSLGVLLSIYWWFLIFWNVGGGFNEFNKKESLIRIFRWGYPGQNRLPGCFSIRTSFST